MRRNQKKAKPQRHPRTFHELCSNPLLIEGLISKLSKGVSIHEINANLKTAAYSGNLKAIEALISAGADVNTNDHGTPIVFAANGGSLEAVTMLLNAGADVNRRSSDKISALMHATLKGNIKIIQKLLSAGADVNLVDAEGNTALLSGLKNLEILRLLISAGADVNYKKNEDDTPPLQIIAYSYSDDKIPATLDILRLLISAGADVHAKDRDGLTALIWVATRLCGDTDSTLKESNKVETFKILLAESSQKEIDEIAVRIICNYHTSDMDAINLVLAAGANVEPLLAGRPNRLEIFKRLLSAGANVNAKDEEGLTPLMGYTDVGCIKLLLASRADVNAKDKRGRTALMLNRYNENILSLLISAGANIHEKDNEGMTALMWAAADPRCDSSIIRFLISKRARTFDTNFEGWTPLMLAAACLHNKETTKLLVLMSDTNAENLYGTSILMCAANAGQVTGLELLVSPKRELDKSNPESWKVYLVNHACSWHDSQVVINYSYRTPKPYEVDVVEYLNFILNKADIDINKQNQDGWTALMFAAYSNNAGAVQVLLERGADIKLRNIYHKTALDIAAQANNTDVLRVFMPGSMPPAIGWDSMPAPERSPRTIPGKPGERFPFFSPPHEPIKTRSYGEDKHLVRYQNLYLFPSCLPSSSPPPFSTGFPPSATPILSGRSNPIRQAILEIAKTRVPYWEVLSARYHWSEEDVTKEIVSIQMQLRKNLNRNLAEQHENLSPAIESAMKKGLIDRKTAKAFENINKAANTSKHETDYSTPAF